VATKDILTMLVEADKRTGLPAGTMASIMQQETSGNQKYLDDPTAYHYGLNAEGRRIAGHTGKVSTAFGPFGILESTAADPGFGIKPLTDKTNLQDQIRFASEYAAKRGLANYGEGAKYAQQVTSRLPSTAGQDAPIVQPVVDNQVQQVALAEPVQQAPVQKEWQQLQQAMPIQQVQASDINYGEPAPSYSVPSINPLAYAANRTVPNFSAFSRWKGKV